MKIFKKLALTLSLIFCACFVFACGDDAPKKTQLDYAVSVNTQGNYVEVADKSEFSQFVTDSGANKIDTNIGVKFSMYMGMDLGEGSSMSITANAIILKTENEDFNMAMKMNMGLKSSESPMPFAFESALYKQNTNYYVSATAYGQSEKYYFTQEDIDSENPNASLDEFYGAQDFDFENTLTEIETLIQAENSIVTKSETVENGKTVVKYKVFVPSLTEGVNDSVAVIVLTDGQFTGMYYSADISGMPTNIHLVPFKGTIEYPSFNGYKHINEMFPA